MLLGDVSLLAQLLEPVLEEDAIVAHRPVEHGQLAPRLHELVLALSYQQEVRLISQFLLELAILGD